MFGYIVHGPLKVAGEGWPKDSKTSNLLDCVSEFKYRLYKACDLAHENLKETQEKIKTWHDQKSRDRVFNVGDIVLVLLPILGEPLMTKLCRPYTIDKKVGDVDCIVCTVMGTWFAFIFPCVASIQHWCVPGSVALDSPKSVYFR